MVSDWVLYVIIAVLTTAFLVSLLPHRHRWERAGRIVHTTIYGDGFGGMTNRVTGHKTQVPMVCAKCGKPKMWRVNGRWEP